MSLLAGVFSRHPDRAPHPATCGELLAALSRAPGDQPQVYRGGRCFLAHLDRGAFGAPGVLRASDGSVTVVTGEPLLGGENRAVDTAVLHAGLMAGSHDPLPRTRGVYALVQHDPARGILRLASDRLAVRPLYLWIGADEVVFASALRVLEQVARVPRVMDLRGATEVAALGIPLARRTVYAGIERIAAGELIEVDAKTVRRTRYWRWDDLPEVELRGDALAAEVDRRFRDAVTVRLNGDRGARAFLSGGMDSRAVVACLTDAGARVHTFNFAGPGMQDAVFAEAYAREAGTLHSHATLRTGMGGAKYSDTLAQAWMHSPHRFRHPVERPMLAWSGDGGSVGAGYVYLSPEGIRLCRAGDEAGAVDAFLRDQALGIPRRILNPVAAEQLSVIPRQGILDELAALRAPDPARRLHLFLMLNDQRRHLTEHFEHLDLHRTELQLPFFDSHLLELLLAAPVDEFVGHKLYARWFERLPASVRAVPWQTYPGHEPCPLPVPRQLGWQWAPQAFPALRAQRRRKLLREVAEMLTSPDFPRPLLRRGPLAAASLVYAARFRDYSYVIRPALVLHGVHAACHGRISDAPAPGIPA